jgi:hypothetical protein
VEEAHGHRHRQDLQSHGHEQHEHHVHPRPASQLPARLAHRGGEVIEVERGGDLAGRHPPPGVHRSGDDWVSEPMGVGM